MTKEFDDYFTALVPPSPLPMMKLKSSNSPSPTSIVSSISQSRSDSMEILKANEITMVRTFITFALARMHELNSHFMFLEEKEGEDEDQNELMLLNIQNSIDTWASYARMCT
jgi:hypothetical protein